MFGKEEEPLVLEELVEEVVNHCASHLRFRKNCPECIKLVGVNGWIRKRNLQTTKSIRK